VSPVKYELGFYITEQDILHSHRREYLISGNCFGNVRNISRVSLVYFTDITHQIRVAFPLVYALVTITRVLASEILSLSLRGSVSPTCLFRVAFPRYLLFPSGE
jgi:hypothetical protein